MSQEKDLVEAIRVGDMRAFESLFRNFYPALVNYAGTLVRDRDEAEDIVQQLFVHIWDKRTELGIHTSVRSFLFRSVYNASINRIRHVQIRREHAEQVQYQARASSSLQELEGKELSERIARSIEQLPEQCGKIFRMSRYESMKYQEIADALGLSVKTVENQMGKALKLLREDLKEYLSIALVLFLLSPL